MASKHPTKRGGVVSIFVLPIAAGQLAIAGLLAAGGRWILFAAALYVMWARMPAMAARARQ